jgi:DNA polymerase
MTPLLLDKRDRAMLAEMGIGTAWLPQPVEAPEAPETPEKIAGRATQKPDSITKQSVIAKGIARPAIISVPPPEPAAAPALGPRPAGIESMDWPALESAVAGCRACGLCAGRTQTVFGVGSRTADWMVVGEAPGEQEDRQGQPFVGQAGKLLDNMLAAIGLSRQSGVDPPPQEPEGRGAGRAGGVYIANVLKCRPPANRNPQPEEVAQCEPYLRRQAALIQPRIILAMGRFAVQSLLQTTEPIGRLRGRVHHYQGVPVIVTYHPAYLLRALSEKAKAWQDLCLAVRTAGEP